MEFSRQEYWGGLPFPSAEDLSNPGIKPRSPTLQADSLLSEPPGKPQPMMTWCKIAKAWSSIVKVGTKGTIHAPEFTVGSGWRWVPAETIARLRVSFVKFFLLLSFSPNQTPWSPFQALFLGISLKSTPCLADWASYEAFYVHHLTKSSVKPVR